MKKGGESRKRGTGEKWKRDEEGWGEKERRKRERQAR